MIALILIIHLTFATAYTISATMLAIAAVLRKATPTVNRVMFAGFSATIASGLGLIIVSPKAIGQFCISALIATLCGVVVAKTYKRRVIAFHTA